MTPHEALDALLTDALVRGPGGPPCRPDSVYRSIEDGAVRVRVSDRYGLSHSYPVEHLELVEEVAAA